MIHIMAFQRSYWLVQGQSWAFVKEVLRHWEEKGGVSLVCWRLFDRQPRKYKESVLPPSVWRKVSVEARSPIGWREYVGERGWCMEWMSLELVGLGYFWEVWVYWRDSYPNSKVFTELVSFDSNVNLCLFHEFVSWFVYKCSTHFINCRLFHGMKFVL